MYQRLTLVQEPYPQKKNICTRPGNGQMGKDVRFFLLTYGPQNLRSCYGNQSLLQSNRIANMSCPILICQLFTLAVSEGKGKCVQSCRLPLLAQSFDHRYHDSTRKGAFGFI